MSASSENPGGDNFGPPVVETVDVHHHYGEGPQRTEGVHRRDEDVDLGRAEPEGTVDPVVSLVSFWDGERPLAVLSYFATHPQSYYRTGLPNPDFPGLARFFRQLAVPTALQPADPAKYITNISKQLNAGVFSDATARTWRDRVVGFMAPPCGKDVGCD